jgi:hypothetical protein
MTNAKEILDLEQDLVRPQQIFALLAFVGFELGDGPEGMGDLPLFS